MSNCPTSPVPRDVLEIQSTGRAFCALTSDRRVVTWGEADFGGDSSNWAREGFLHMVAAFLQGSWREYRIYSWAD